MPSLGTSVIGAAFLFKEALDKYFAADDKEKRDAGQRAGVDRFAVLIERVDGDAYRPRRRAVEQDGGRQLAERGEEDEEECRDHAGADQLRALFPHVTRVEAVEKDGGPVSSTRIRKALAEGRLEEANRLLGRPFSVQGEVVHGEGRGGPLLGIPTANLDVPHSQAMTAPAVYATSARLLDGEGAGRWHMSVTSFCKNPTFDGSVLTLETHIMDFSGDIYGRGLEVRFLALLRRDRRFDGLDALKAQLHADMDERRSLPL